jgi:hypothetical protein
MGNGFMRTIEGAYRLSFVQSTSKCIIQFIFIYWMDKRELVVRPICARVNSAHVTLWEILNHYYYEKFSG